RLKLAPQECSTVERRAQSVREHEILILPCRPDGKPYLQLPGTMPPKRCHGALREEHLAPTVRRLGVREDVALLGLAQRPVHLCVACLKVNVTPGQGEQLALAHAGREGDDVEPLKHIA